MINIKKIFDDSVVCEGIQTPKHIFDDGQLTFAQIRDILTKVFSGSLDITEDVDGLDILLTYKNGKFCVAQTTKELKEPLDYDDLCKKQEGMSPDIATAFQNSLHDMSIALSELDPIQLNRFFANGQNFMKCKIVYPPCENVVDYGNKCIIVLDKVLCFNEKYKEVGEDVDVAKQLFDILKNNGALQQEMFEIQKPNLLKLKSMLTSKDILAKIIEKLEHFIDGVGWKCTLNGYIQDQYSRHIINKALQYGLDVSRGSDFVNELANRLSNVSGRKPTKSDLITFAKRDGIDCKSEQYKNFLNELETNCESTNAEIIKPIENLIAYAALMLMKSIEGYMSVDPSRTASKAMSTIDNAIMQLKEDDIDLSPDNIARLKKNLARIERYHEMMPAAGVLVRYHGKVFKLTPNFGAANEILNIINYK